MTTQSETHKAIATAYDRISTARAHLAAASAETSQTNGCYLDGDVAQDLARATLHACAAVRMLRSMLVPLMSAENSHKIDNPTWEVMRDALGASTGVRD